MIKLRWEYLKFKIRDQTIAFSKVLSANKHKEIFSLERKLLSLEKEFEERNLKKVKPTSIQKRSLTIFMTRKQKEYVLGADVSGTRPAKNLEFFLKILRKGMHKNLL